MLAHVLALMVGLGSFALYMAAFFFPEIHRKNDFIWSGVGLFYALVLWVCAGRITGSVLLGQIAGVTLLGWLGWQTVLLRRQTVPVEQQTAIPSTEDVKGTLSNLVSPEGRSQLVVQATRLFSQVKDGVQGAISTATQPKAEPATAPEEYTPPDLDEFGTAGQEAIERFAKAALLPEEPLKPEKQVEPESKEVVNAISQPPTPSPAAKTITPPESLVDRSGALPQRTGNVVKVIAETVQALLKSFTNQKESKPVYVRKQYREEAETISSPVADAPAKKSKPVYVRKQYREEAEKTEPPTPDTGKKKSKPVYVRKQYREEAEKPEPPVTEATVISVIETVERASDGSLVADTAIEIVSDDIAPDLLAGALSDATLEPDATVEEMVEELLEEISVQEEAVEQMEQAETTESNANQAEVARAVPPHPPSSDLVEAAIADAEEKGLPYDPPEAEEETNW